MASPEFLVDTSVWARLHRPSVYATFAPLAATGKTSLCAPIRFEVCFSARNSSDYRALADRLDAFASVPVSDADHQRALEVQELLTPRSQHRSLSLVDALVAAVAEARNLTVLHYDADYERIAKVSGQTHRWVVPRGTAD